MNKKRGAVELTTGKMIGAVIAIFVLVVVILGVMAYFFSVPIPFFKNLFNFGVEQPKVVGSEIVGYNLEQGVARYYDGTSWLDFPKIQDWKSIVLLNDKKIDGVEVKNAFESYYFAKRDTKKISLGGNVNAYFIGVLEKLSDFGKIGDILISLVYETNNGKEVYGNLYMDLNGKFIYSKINKDFDYTLYTDVLRSEGVKYRNGMLKGEENARAMPIVYDGRAIKVCVEERNKYLVASLDEEVLGDEECK